MDTKIHRDEIFSPNRDELFLNRICEHISELQSIGMADNDIKATLGTFQYVRVYVNTPRFLYPCLRIPNGYSFTRDGIKVRRVGKGRYESKTWYILPIGNNLYIKGVGLPGTNISDPQICYVKDYKKLKGNDVANVFENELHDEILMFYKNNDLPLGFIEPITHSMSEYIINSILSKYRSIQI